MGASSSKDNLPELRITSDTWTRESHGLYDFDGTETQFKISGSHNVIRQEHTVRPIAAPKFEHDNQNEVIARCLYRQGSYWVYHKALVDDLQDCTLE